MLNSVSKNKLSSFKLMKNEECLYVLKTKIFNQIDDYNFLCFILLSNDQDIIPILVREYHKTRGHIGAQIIMTNLRERF